MEVVNLLQFSHRNQLREWLQQNHTTQRECWVVVFVKHRPEWPALPYVDTVEEALCFGWIDSTKKKLPDGRLAQRLSPRRPGSHWTELNRLRCLDLQRRALMTPAGLAALEP